MLMSQGRSKCETVNCITCYVHIWSMSNFVWLLYAWAWSHTECFSWFWVTLINLQGHSGYENCFVDSFHPVEVKFSVRNVHEEDHERKVVCRCNARLGEMSDTLFASVIISARHFMEIHKLVLNTLHSDSLSRALQMYTRFSDRKSFRSQWRVWTK